MAVLGVNAAEWLARAPDVEAVSLANVHVLLRAFRDTRADDGEVFLLGRSGVSCVDEGRTAWLEIGVAYETAGDRLGGPLRHGANSYAGAKATLDVHDCSEGPCRCAPLVCYRRQVLVREHVVPPIVLLPGTLCDGRLFGPLRERLPRLAQYPAMQMQTILTTGCDTIHAAAQQVLAAAPRNFALLGFSLGGLVALEVALLAPHRVAGLALLDVNAAPVPTGFHVARRQAVDEARAPGHGRYLSEQVWRTYVGPLSHDNVELQRLLSTMSADLGHAAFRNQTEAALTRRDYRPLLSTLRLPTLVLAGEHDAICSAALQREFAAAIPDATFVLIQNAGHFALLEQQDAVAASVAAWFHTIADVSRFPSDSKETM